MSNSDIFFGEMIGTGLLVLFGGGVCAAISLKQSKAFGAGWIAIAFGWGFGVLAGAYASKSLSGGFINPAVTVGVAITTGDWDKVPLYIAGQLSGAIIGAILVWFVYFTQFQKNTEPSLGIFSTIPAIRNLVANTVTEIIATFALVYVILADGLDKGLALSGTGVLITSLLVVGIGLSLGGPTGYAINPARDLGPRIVHTFLPIPHKGTSDWSYALVPIVGPLIGAAAAGGLYNVFF